MITPIREQTIWAASGDWMVIGPDVAISVRKSCYSAANHRSAQKSTTQQNRRTSAESVQRLLDESHTNMSRSDFINKPEKYKQLYFVYRKLTVFRTINIVWIDIFLTIKHYLPPSSHYCKTPNFNYQL